MDAFNLIWLLGGITLVVAIAWAVDRLCDNQDDDDPYGDNWW